jgi:hypothetical protein
VPSEIADSYRVKVKMDMGPFKVDETAESVIQAAELRRKT